MAFKEGNNPIPFHVLVNNPRTIYHVLDDFYTEKLATRHKSDEFLTSYFESGNTPNDDVRLRMAMKNFGKGIPFEFGDLTSFSDALALYGRTYMAVMDVLCEEQQVTVPEEWVTLSVDGLTSSYSTYLFRS